MIILRKKTISRKLLPLYILLFVCTTKWLFEGVLDAPFLEDVFLLIAMVVAMIQNRGRIRYSALIWILFIANIIFSVALHDPTVGRLGRAGLMSLMMTLILFIDYEPGTYSGLYTCTVKLAVFYAIFVILQFILGTSFNNVYFPLLTPSYRYVANYYYGRKYFFGLIFNPHEIGVLIAIAIIVLILRQMICSKKKKSRVVLAVFLLVPLLMTQKKGVVFVSLFVFFLVICVLYASRKQAIKIFGAAILITVVLFLVVRYALAQGSNSVVLYRIAKFITGLASGEISDSGRGKLYSIALREFSRHKLFGIGWRKFNSTILSSYGYHSGHEVNMDYLQWLCETGIVGFLMNIIPVVVMLGRTIVLCFRYVRRLPDSDKKWVVLTAVYTQFFTVIYACFEIPFYDNLCFGFYVLSCMIINGSYYAMKREESSGRMERTTERDELKT